MHRKIFLDILRSRGIAERMIDLMTGLYYETKCCEAWGEALPTSRLNSGVRQGCVVVHLIFTTCMDWVLEKLMIEVAQHLLTIKVTDLVFANDAVLQ